MSESNVVAMKHAGVDARTLEGVVLGGDLSKLEPAQRLMYYQGVCQSLGLNPLTRPFRYLQLSGNLVLYATKDCTEQLRSLRSVSITITARELLEDVYVVTSRGTMPDGRTDEATGAVSIAGLKGEAKANAMMKAETKSKRRVTLSICGLGLLDESEVSSIPDARLVDVDIETGEIRDIPAAAPQATAPKPTPPKALPFEQQLAKLWEHAQTLHISREMFAAAIQAQAGDTKRQYWTRDQWHAVLDALNDLLLVAEPPGADSEPATE